jgi:hypothetical protein
LSDILPSGSTSLSPVFSTSVSFPSLGDTKSLLILKDKTVFPWFYTFPYLHSYLSPSLLSQYLYVVSLHPSGLPPCFHSLPTSLGPSLLWAVMTPRANPP